jgi:hypothetical protein
VQQEHDQCAINNTGDKRCPKVCRERFKHLPDSRRTLCLLRHDGEWESKDWCRKEIAWSQLMCGIERQIDFVRVKILDVRSSEILHMIRVVDRHKIDVKISDIAELFVKIHEEPTSVLSS